MSPAKDPSTLLPEQKIARAALGARVTAALNEEFPGIGLSTQCQRIAADTGLNYKTVFRTAKGQTSPSFDTLVILARRLGRTVSELTALPVEKMPSSPVRR